MPVVRAGTGEARRRTARHSRRRSFPWLVVVLLCGPLTTHMPAASLTRTATATVTVNAFAKLTLSASTLVFPDSDPDTIPEVRAAGGPVTITAKATTTIGSTVTLVVQAAGDLRSGLDAIPVTQLRWTATGAGFVPGTMSQTAAQRVASWVSSGSWTGTQTYGLLNSWTYATGTYSTTLTYTLTAP